MSRSKDTKLNSKPEPRRPLKPEVHDRAEYGRRSFDLITPEVAFFGHYDSAVAQSQLDAHSHGNAIEICYLAKGRQTYRIAEKLYHLQGGDLFFTLPHQWHDSGGFVQEKGELYWICILMPEEVSAPNYLGLTPDSATTLLAPILSPSRQHFRGSSHCADILNNLITACETPNLDATLTLQRQFHVMAYLHEVTRCMTQDSHSTVSSPIQDALNAIESDLSQTWGVDTLSEIAQLSTSRFKSRFKSEVGIPPAEYVARRKIDQAKYTLEHSTKPITQIALDLGFSSSQYFASTFKKFTLMTPGEYRGEKKG